MSLSSLPHRTLSADQKRRLLAQILQQKAKQPATVALSVAQERLWFFEQFQEGSAVYNIFAPARLIGDLTISILERSLREVMLRHEALRTTFVLEDGIPVQRIVEEPALHLFVEDLLYLPEELREEEARRLALKDAQQPFDLQRGPLLRVLIVRLAEDEHLFLLNIHHIIADGWSSEIILRELSALYSAYTRGTELSLPAQAVQYSNFVHWQQKRGQVWVDHLEYWRHHLTGAQPLQLPVSQNRPPVMTYRGGRQWKRLPAEILTQLNRLSQQEGATLYMTVLSAFTILLARYSGTEDITVGTPAAGRSRQEFENVVGFFVNMLALRTNLTGVSSFLEVLRRTRQVVLDGYTYQDVPFENVVEAVTPERDITRHPLFQVQFALQHVTLQNLQMAGLTVKPYQLHNGTTKFDLSLFAWEEGDGLMTSIEYNADLFAGETVSRILDHLHTLLEHIAADPTRSWVTLPLLTAQEEQKIVHDWNATAVESGRAEDVQTLFERQVEQAPAAPALVYGSEQVSYQELDQRANQLAHYLQQSGVKADTLVGLYLERSPELIIAVLAVLKAGGAYVPLDPSYPAERLVAIAENAHLQTVVTSDQLESKLPENVQRVSIQSLHIAEQSTSRPERMVDPGNLAYVIYTSGSTGTPKGVMISHRGLSNYLNWAIAHYAVSTGNGSVVHSPLAFDLTVTSLFPALLTGKHVVLVPEEEAVEQLVQTVRQGQHFSLLKLTPAHVEILKQFIAPEELAASANALVIGGEALHAESLQAWRQFAPQTRLINEYGPTEAVVGCCIYEIAPGDANTGEVPIGRPIANTCLYVLDKHLCPVPVGIPGELYIGGVGVARGYINQPELTAERFIPDMFHSIPGSRCYKTGDQVRYRPDGVLEFLGRFDHQVKVRGYRIELGEIEVALLRHPAVSECVVTVQGDNSADKILVAYVVSELTQAQAAAQLSAHVREMLPTYMLPSTFVVLKALPLTTNGKVDRQALPVPTLDDAALAAAPTPLTPVAEVIEGIWSRLLQRPHIGLHENFFTCGGHSLLASRVIAQIRAVFQIELPIRTLFEAPTVAQLAQRVEAVLRQAGSAQPDLPLLPVERPQDIPLALAQQRLWFLEQLELTEPLYNVPLAVRLGGPLDLPALEASVLDLVQRHESLRTTFAEGPHGPVQHIHDHLPPRWLYRDLRALPAEEQTRTVTHLFAQEQQERFDLRQGPLLRVQVLCVGDQEHVLLLSLHHIIADAWSLQVLLRDWGQYYTARLRGDEAALSVLPVQYADYALWQRAWMDGERMKEQEGYWQRQLQGAPELLELPTDRPRGSTSHHRGASVLFELSAEVIAGLRTLSQQEGSSLYMTLLAGYQLLLSKYTRQEDIVVGTPSGQRTREEVQELIGFLVNTLAIRTSMQGNPSVREVLRRVRQAALDAYTHQEVPFERVVELVGGERDLSHSPIFQVAFVYEQMAVQQSQFADLSLASLDLPSAISKFEISLGITETEHGYRGTFQYNQDLFDAATIQRLARYYLRVLEIMVSDPDQHCDTLPMMTEQERQQLLQQSNTPALDDVQTRCVHEIFEEQVRRQPDATAVVFENISLTYMQLDQRANALAARLRKLGVGVETPVAICLERSLELVISILGVLKAGGMYVPLDPAYPQDRLALMLQDSQAQVVLSSRSLEAVVPCDSVCFVDNDDLSLEYEAFAPQPSLTTPENVVYMIYTSGSTGRPKGVAVTHRALSNHMFWMQQTFAFQPSDRILQRTSSSFDASVWEFYGPLLCGAQLIIDRPGATGDVERLLEILQQQHITVVQVVPSLLRMLLQTGQGLNPCRTLRYVFCGGEDLTSDLQEHFLQQSSAALYNLYGPTEVCIDIASWHCRPITSSRIPVGHPIFNVEVYILDRHLQPVPAGAVGELYIGGRCLSRGYYQRPELTAERFVPHPFSHTGERLYRSGDLARFLPDGAIVLLGRIDNQVKLRGFRIELGEIEAQLLLHPAVRQATVLVREDVPGDKRLVGYIVLRSQSTVKREELQSFLSKDLPPYMLPSAFVVMDSLPLTTNAKIDWRALPAPTALEPEAILDGDLPTTPVQEVVLGIWRHLLQHPTLGIQANFFAYGGHSLLAGRVIAQIRSVFQIDLPIRSLFEAPTVAQLAQRVEGALRQTGSAQQEHPLLPMERPQDIPLALAQQRLWFLEQLELAEPLYNVPFAVRLGGTLDLHILQASLLDLVQRHESLRTTFAEGPHGPVQHIHDHLPPRWLYYDLRYLHAEVQTRAVKHLFAQEQQERFDLRQGPLLRVQVVCIDDQEHVLLVTLHHIIADAWSLQVLLRDWGLCYAARCRKEDPSLTPLPVQYVDYALWQRAWMDGERMKEQEEYWRKQLQGAPELLELPTDRLRGSTSHHRGANELFVLSDELIAGLRTLSQQEGSSLYMTLLAGYQLLLSKYTRQEDIVVGTPSGQRTREEVQGMIGFLVNTLAIRTSMQGNPSVREVLRRVRRAALDAYTHQEVPFERVVELVGGERDLSHSPIFQVAFIYEQMAVQQSQFADLSLASLDLPSTIAKFEVSLIVRETQHEVCGAISYNQDLFDAETIQRMCGHYQQILTEMVRDPNGSIGSIEMLTPEEHRLIVNNWNATRSEYSTEYSIPQLIALHAHRHPASLAIEGPEPQQRITYQDLNQRANQIARYLQRQGIGAESLVCVCMERSIDLITAELAILKAGAAYVPLDPTHPISRLSYMLQDVQPSVLLTQQHVLQLVTTASEECNTITVACIDSQEAPCWQEETQDLDQPIAQDQLAYIIYTSGSTGTPKGVQIAHRGLLNLVNWYQRTFQVTGQDRSAHLASVGFDGTVWEIWPILCAGATLVLPDEQTRISADLLQQWYIQQRVTLSFAPTPLAEQLLMLSWPAETALRYLHTAGDQLHTFPASDLPFVLVNDYGPTENTVEATYEYVLPTGGIQADAKPAIGRPIANVEAYILNASLQPVPVGVPGELYLGGVAIARGYLNRADVTAERFIPHPFSKGQGERLYKTGDVCSYLPDGRVNFIGRNDRQVKIRGFRIELGEVEALIQQYASVKHVAVVADTNARGHKQLVAYVAPEAGQSLEIGELRQSLRMKAPEYMVPSFFIILEALPLTSSGKLNRKALPALEQVVPSVPEASIAPQTKLEQQIAHIWQEVLQCEKVGIQENFFDLGGHSLRMAQVHRQLQEVFQRQIPLIDLFQYSTIQSLALYLQQENPGVAFQKRDEQIQGGKQRLRHLRQRQQQMRGAR